MPSPIAFLRCPISGQTLNPAPEKLVCALQDARRAGGFRSRSGEFPEPFESGLITSNGAWFYPIRSGIPVLLAGEAVEIAKAKSGG